MKLQRTQSTRSLHTAAPFLLAAAIALPGLAAPAAPAYADESVALINSGAVSLAGSIAVGGTLSASGEVGRLELGGALLEQAAVIERQASYAGGGFHAPQLRRARALTARAVEVYGEALRDAPDDGRALSGLARALDFFHPTLAGAEIWSRLAIVAGTASDPPLLGG